jgi:hypothetical protein
MSKHTKIRTVAGYFEVWARPCCDRQYQVDIECVSAKERAQARQQTREALRPCVCGTR